MDKDITFNDLPKMMGDLMFQVQKMSIKLDTLEMRSRQAERDAVTHNPHRPMSTEDVCKLVHRKKDTVYKLARAGEIPCYRKGKFLEFFEDEIINWLSESKVKSVNQAICEAESYCQSHPL